MTVRSFASKAARRALRILQQATRSQFLARYWYSWIADTENARLHRTGVALIVSSRWAALMQVLVLPLRWITGNCCYAWRYRRDGEGVIGFTRRLGGGLWGTLRYNPDMDSWYRYEIWDKRHQDPLGFVSHAEITKLLPLLNTGVDTQFLGSKAEFDLFCRANALPACDILATFRQGKIAWATEEERLPEADLFVKWDHLYCGMGAERWHWCSAKRDWSRGELSLDEAGLLARFSESSLAGTLILQRCLVNHAKIEPLTNGSVATLRVVTSRPPGERPRVLACCLRMPVGSSEVDNFAAGGLASGIREDGTMTAAVSKNGRVRVGVHPDSGYRFQDEQLPMFEDAKVLCVKAHSLFTRPHFVGWDIAFGPSGPVLLEANMTWGVDMIQMAHGRPMGAWGFVDDFMKCYDASFHRKQ